MEDELQFTCVSVVRVVLTPKLTLRGKLKATVLTFSAGLCSASCHWPSCKSVQHTTLELKIAMSKMKF